MLTSIDAVQLLKDGSLELQLRIALSDGDYESMNNHCWLSKTMLLKVKLTDAKETSDFMSPLPPSDRFNQRDSKTNNNAK